MDRLFTLETTATRQSIPLIHGLLQGQLELLKFGPNQAMRFQMAVEEAVLNVVQHAYPDEPGALIVKGTLQQSMLVVAVEDRGLPRDPFQRLAYSEGQPDAPGLGSRLMQAMADGVRYQALGRGGKEVELMARLPGGQWDADATTADSSPPPEVDGHQLTVRLFQPEDAGQVAQCAWRCYAYSYISDHLYLPERLAKMNASGELLSAVAVDGEGRVYGHSAMIFSPGSRVPESGQAFVSPEARGGGAFSRMKRLLIEELNRRGVVGYWSEATTMHPASQKSNLKLGIHECGLQLGIMPPTIRMKAIGEATDRRIALMLFYDSLEDQPKSRVCLPSHHCGLLRRLYERLGFELENVEPGHPAPDSESELKVDLRPDIGIAWFRVNHLGCDLMEMIARERVKTCESGARVIVLDLPIDSPALPATVAALEVKGWVLAGILPRLFAASDALRMLYLDNVVIEPAGIHTASEFGEELKHYLLSTLPPGYLADS